MQLLLASDVEKVFGKVTQSGLLRPHRRGVFIPTASLGQPYGAFFEHVVRSNFRQAGVHMSLLELDQAKPLDVRTTLQDVSLLYVGGGNTFRLLEHMRATGFATPLAGFLNRGGLYIGSSAGAVVAGPDVGFIACMDDNAAVQLSDFTGLGLLDFNILPHTDHPRHREAARQAHLGRWPALGLREQQLLLVQQTYMEVL